MAAGAGQGAKIVHTKDCLFRFVLAGAKRKEPDCKCAQAARRKSKRKQRKTINTYTSASDRVHTASKEENEEDEEDEEKQTHEKMKSYWPVRDRMDLPEVGGQQVIAPNAQGRMIFKKYQPLADGEYLAAVRKDKISALVHESWRKTPKTLTKLLGKPLTMAQLLSYRAQYESNPARRWTAPKKCMVKDGVVVSKPVVQASASQTPAFAPACKILHVPCVASKLRKKS